ncbi:MAG: hypothetical protein QXY64_04080 [Candidatus Bilamarchaeaceae archaeon]
MKKIALFLLLIFAIASAENYVVVNSIDGRDVLSGIFYANVKNEPVKFMAYPNGDAEFLAMKVGKGKEVLLIQSKDRPVSTTLKQAIERRGSTVQIFESIDGGQTNLDLAVRSGAKKFIIVDSAYADGALSTMSYAALKGAYVIFADKNNIDNVVNVVKDANEIIVYGYADAAVKEKLGKLGKNIKYIGKGEDRYEDNVEVSRILMKDYNITSVYFVEGTFIEEGMVDSKIPFVLSGRLVPDVTYNFVKEMVKQDQLKTSYLIGGTKITTAIRDMRKRIEADLQEEGINKTFGIWMRYAQVIPSSGTDNKPTALDVFPLPAYIPKLAIGEVFYNRVDKTLNVRVDNVGDGPAYFLTDIRVQVDGKDYKVFGTDNAELIEREDKKGLTYSLDLSQLESGNVSAIVIVKYGSGKRTIEDYVTYTGPLAFISYVDKSNVTAKSIRYDKNNKTLVLFLKNAKDTTAYASPDVEMFIDGEKTIIVGPRNIELPANALVPVSIPAELKDSDLEANPEVTVYVQYGSRMGYLVNKGTFRLPLEYEKFDYLICIGGALLLLILLAIAYYLWQKQKKR